MVAKTEPYAPKLHKPATLDHLRKREPLERTVQIVMSDAPVEAVQKAKDRVSKIEMTLSGLDSARDKTAFGAAQREANEAREALKLALEDQDEEVFEVRFRGIGRKRYSDLMDAHKPTEEQKKKAEENGGLVWQYNPETFPVALVAACCVEPVMTLEETREIYDEWNYTEWSPLFNAAIEVNNGRRAVEEG